MKPKIIMIVRRLKTGTEAYSLNLVKWLENLGFDVVVCNVGLQENSALITIRLDKGYPSSLDGKYISVLIRPLICIMGLRRIVDNSTQLFFSQALDEIGFTCLLASLVYGRKGITFVHDLTLREFLLDKKRGFWTSFLHAALRLRQRIVARNLAKLLVGSEFMKKEITKDYGVIPAKTCLGTDFPANVEVRKEVRKLLYLGNFTGKKRPDLFVKTISLLRDTDITASMVGDGPLRDGMIKLAESLSIGEKILFTGYISPEKKDKIMRESSVFVSTSMWEGFGLAVLEAMSYGMPVISCTGGAVSELVKDGYNGYNVSPEPKEIADKIIMLKEDKELFSKLSENALKTARSYSWQRTAVKTAQIIMQVLRDK